MVTYIIYTTYFNVFLPKVESFRQRADPEFSASFFLVASGVQFADSLAVGIEVEVEEDLEVGVEKEVVHVVGAGRLPLPVWHPVFISGILNIEQNK
jgi:hypothetical protein